MAAASEQAPARLLVIACGALAHEIVWLQKLNGWGHLDLQCLDAELHNKPKLIASKLAAKIEQNRRHYKNIFVAYADCGSGGAIDALLVKEGVERLPGDHCYSFFAGEERFTQMAAAELGSFYLTDFLVEHFDRLVVKGLKLDRYPDLRDQYFAHYTSLVYLSQRQDPVLVEQARAAADFLDLNFRHEHSGYGDLQTGLQEQILKLV